MLNESFLNVPNKPYIEKELRIQTDFFSLSCLKRHCPDEILAWLFPGMHFLVITQWDTG